MAALIKILIKGGDFLRFASTGGNRVLLVDGELPAQLLQARLQKLVGVTKPGQLLLRAVAKLEGHQMPLLRDEQAQEDFIKFCKKHDRTVIIFDTRGACFGYDPATEMDAIQSVNRFLIRLRAEGYTVITTHHAGKNDTQRGRTDNDDHLDLIMKLERSDKDDPLLSFNLTWEKVRYGDPLKPFSARFDDPDGWELIGDAAKQLQEEAIRRLVLEMTEKEMSQEEIGKTLRIRKQRVGEIQRKAKANDAVPA
jgi:predicted XRE-type DNA-binding protein